MVPTKGKWTVFWLGAAVFVAGFALGVVLHHRDLIPPDPYPGGGLPRLARGGD